MQFTVEIPDSEAQRIAQAVCAHDGYGAPDLMAAVEHTKNHVFRHLARITVEQEASAAAAQAADAVRSNATDPLAQALFAPVTPPGPQPGPAGPTGETGPAGPTGAIGGSRR